MSCLSRRSALSLPHVGPPRGDHVAEDCARVQFRRRFYLLRLLPPPPSSDGRLTVLRGPRPARSREKAPEEKTDQFFFLGVGAMDREPTACPSPRDRRRSGPARVVVYSLVSVRPAWPTHGGEFARTSNRSWRRRRLRLCASAEHEKQRNGILPRRERSRD